LGQSNERKKKDGQKAGSATLEFKMHGLNALTRASKNMHQENKNGKIYTEPGGKYARPRKSLFLADFRVERYLRRWALEIS